MTPLPPAAVAALALGAAIVGAVVGVLPRRVIARVPGAYAPRRPGVEAATGLLFALVAGVAASRIGAADAGWPASPPAVVLTAAAFLWLAAASVVLAIVDIETRRLPDRIVLPCYASGGVLLGAAAIVSGDLGAAIRAGVGLLALGGFFLLLRVIRPDGMGGGDVKLAGVLGLHLGWVGWAPLAVGAVAAFLLGGLVSAAIMLLRRRGTQTTIAFGPWMLAGAWIGLAWGDPLTALYTASLALG